MSNPKSHSISSIFLAATLGSALIVGVPLISEYADVNHAIEGHISAKQIQGALETRNGKAFRAFAHLSHIYSIPYKQYSELTFQNKNDSVVVSVSNWYRLTFDHTGAHPVISKWEYIQLENE